MNLQIDSLIIAAMFGNSGIIWQYKPMWILDDAHEQIDGK